MLWPQGDTQGQPLHNLSHFKPLLIPQRLMLIKSLPGQGEEPAERRVGRFLHPLLCPAQNTCTNKVFVALKFCLGVFAAFCWKGRALGGADCCGCIICIDIKCMLDTKSSLVCTATSAWGFEVKTQNYGFDVWRFYQVTLKALVLQRNRNNIIYINLHYSTEAWKGPGHKGR